MGFNYDKEITRVVCRGCAEKYDDSYFADVADMCSDCGLNSGHCCFTNEPKREVE